MKTKWKLLVSFIKSKRYIVALTFFSGLFYNIFTLLIPISLGRFYEFNFGFSSYRLKLLGEMLFINTLNFNSFLVFFVSLVFIRFVFEFINKYLIAILGEGFAKELREQLFEHQLQVHTSIYNEKGIGKYLLRYSGDLKSIQNYISRGLFRFSQDVFLILFLLMVIAYIDVYLGAIVAGSIIISNIILYYINTILYTISVSRRNQRSGLLTFVNTRLCAIMSIKMLNKYSIEQKRYVKRSKKLFAIGKKYQLTVGFIQSIIPALTYIMLALLMWYIYYIKTTQENAFNQSAVLVLILLIISFLPILRRTLRVSIVWKLGNISFEKLLAIFSLETENKIPLKRINLSNKDIRLNKVSFKYNSSGKIVFRNLNIHLFSKKMSIIIGVSGSGKDTLLNLLLKVYQPTQGRIMYGKITQNELSEKAIRRNISIVSDEFPLYGKTVYEAIVFSRNEERKKKAIQLLSELQQYEDPKNRIELNDHIGDLGALLTSGQKRILLYCRALLNHKPWLIIDKPFSNLNPKTAQYLKNKLNTMKNNKGLIIFDNSLPKGLNADYTYSIKNSTINLIY